MLTGSKILLGVCGGIACYRACELARMLVRAGAEVTAVLTPNASRFVSALTFEALTGRPAPVYEYAGPAGERTEDLYAHLNLTRGIDCFAIVPASANTIGKLAQGIADNLLGGAYLSCTAPVVIAPAMNVRMWQHPAVQHNLELLRARGNTVLDVGSGKLACGDEGEGRLAELDGIFAAIEHAVAAAALPDATQLAASTYPATNGAGSKSIMESEGLLAGRRFIVSAGGTREYLDPVRFITNASSGELALAVIEALLAEGAAVELVDSGIAVPPSLEARLAARHEIATAFDLQKTLFERIADCDGLVMLAAVADYGPAKYSPHKRKKDGAAWSIELCETPDVLASLSAHAAPGKLLVGVSLEDEDFTSRAMKKAAAKGVELMLAVELTPQLPYGKRALNCALVTRDDILAGPQWRSKDEAAGLISAWLAARLAGSRAG